MAQRRMMTKDLAESPDFERLSKDARFALLMIHLYADDDGFIKIQEAMFRGDCGDPIIQEIVEAGWIFLQNNIIKVDEWNFYQTIKNDRYKPSGLKKYFEKGSNGKKPLTPEKANHQAMGGELSSKQQREFFDGYKLDPNVSHREEKKRVEENRLDVNDNTNVLSSRDEKKIKRPSEIAKELAQQRGFGEKKFKGSNHEWQTVGLQWYVKLKIEKKSKDKNSLGIFLNLFKKYGVDFMSRICGTAYEIEEKLDDPLAYVLSLVKDWKKKSKK